MFKSLREPNDRPQTPTSSDVRGNSFHLEFPEEKEQREFEILWDISVPKANSEGSKIEKDLCCLYWNLGIECVTKKNRKCQRLHVCSREECRHLPTSSHRAIQHPPEFLCEGHRDRLRGMNKIHPVPLSFHNNSSVEDTKEACRVYGIKPPSLNADLFKTLLKTTDINEELQQSLVRGWREGLDLGADLPNKDQIVEEIALASSQRITLNNSLQSEVEKRRLKGPLKHPIRDGRWFVNAWVSPYFAIPKKVPLGEAKKWRLIHHLSFHPSGLKELSLNGSIDLSRYPTYFPTHLSGAHLIFCQSPPGSALIGRDIRDYYRNFLLNPYS